MKYSNVITNCMRSGILLLTLQLAGNSLAACDSDKSQCDSHFSSESARPVSEAMQSQYHAMRTLYLEFGDDLVWLLESKLGTGTAEERYAVLQVFAEFRIYPLLDQVITSTTDSSNVRTAPGKTTRVSEYAEEALIGVARKVGLWREDYRSLYRNGSMENWKALFWDFQKNFGVSTAAVGI